MAVYWPNLISACGDGQAGCNSIPAGDDCEDGEIYADLEGILDDIICRGADIFSYLRIYR